MVSGLATTGSEVYKDGPPPGHTGGFGEPTCRACHFDTPADDSAGSLALIGIPEDYVAGRRYKFRIRLTRPGMSRAGFQLSVRFIKGEGAGGQAGSLKGLSGRVRVVVDTSGVQYVSHTLTGTILVTDSSSNWRLQWTAPRIDPSSPGEVVFHVAANAANGDDSEFGDYVYAGSAKTHRRGTK